MTGRRGFLRAAAAGALAAPAVARADTPLRWRMVTSWPRNLPGPGVTAQRLADRIAAMSGGRLEVQLFAAGELVPALEVLDAVQGGTAEMAHTASFFWAGKMPAAQFFTGVPFGLLPLEHAAWIEHGGGQALWDELYAPFGVKPFMAGNTGTSMGGWFRKELTGLGDLKGLRWRMPGLGGEMIRELGAVPALVPPPEIVTALQSGAIDATEFLGPWSDLAAGFYKAAPYYYWPGLHEPNGTGEAIVSLAAWEALPADLQSVVENACRAEAAYAVAEAEWQDQAALEALVGEHGVQLRRFPDEIVDAARVAAADVLAAFDAMGGIEQRIYRSFRAMRERAIKWSRVSSQAFLEARNVA
jgi:TRAP-type mannitol/chloroaromatic compound transport system substrate-binding protein